MPYLIGLDAVEGGFVLLGEQDCKWVAYEEPRTANYYFWANLCDQLGAVETKFSQEALTNFFVKVILQLRLFIFTVEDVVVEEAMQNILIDKDGAGIRMTVADPESPDDMFVTADVFEMYIGEAKKRQDSLITMDGFFQFLEAHRLIMHSRQDC